MAKKLMMLAMTVGAFIAFAAPAIAQADTWAVNGVAVGQGEANKVTVTSHGEIAATAKGGAVQLGPCEVNDHGYIWNEGTNGRGTIDSFTITPGCFASFEGTPVCEITEAEASTATPWAVSVTGTEVAIAGANFRDVFNAGCVLGPEAGAFGTATGVFDNATSSVVFESSGDLETPEGEAINLDGSDTISAAGGAVTLQP